MPCKFQWPASRGFHYPYELFNPGVNKHELHQFDLRPAVAAKFVDSLDLSAQDMVYEVGPGTGALTSVMLETGARVFAVEFDSERAAALRQQFSAAMMSGQLQILCGDARQLLPGPEHHGNWRIIANPPFMHTADFLRQWLLEDLPAGAPRRIDVVLQRQAADKWHGQIGQYCAGHTRSSILARLYGEPSAAQDLHRDDVRPSSHVDLCTWSLVGHEYGPATAELRCVDTLLEIGFAGPHTMREALRKITTPAILKRQGKMAQWRGDDHPRSLKPQAWLFLAQFLRSIQKI